MLYSFGELRKIKGWEKYVDNEPKNKEELAKIIKIKRNCNIIPTKLYILHAFIPPIAVGLGLIFTRNKINIDN